MNKEELKIHPIYTNYGCDENGNVYNLKTGRLMKPILYTTKYYNYGCYMDKKKFKISAHKFIYECFNDLVTLSTNSGEGLTIDHIDGNPSNNSIQNLQLLSTRENTQKSCKNKTSKFCGVCWNKRDKIFQSQITFQSENIYLGSFTNELDAAIAYDDKYFEIHGIRPNNT